MLRRKKRVSRCFEGVVPVVTEKGTTKATDGTLHNYDGYQGGSGIDRKEGTSVTSVRLVEVQEEATRTHRPHRHGASNDGVIQT